MASQPAKRVRTGCLKCRVRRRKCDEGKPQCQRCITGGFECQYGTRLSFLQKNAFTVDEPSVPAEKVSFTPSYRKVQFVNDASEESSIQDQQQQPLPLQLHLQQKGGLDTHIARRDSTSGASHRDGLIHPKHAILSGPTQPSVVRHPETTIHPWSPGILSSPGTSGGDRIALDALLSLGNEHATVFIDRNVHRTSAGSPSYHGSQSPGVYHNTLTDHGDTGHDVSLSPTLDADFEQIIPEEYEFSLLKHYRYEVAPWLDICDLGQTFGMAVPCLGNECPLILQSLLNLSAESLKAVAPSVETQQIPTSSLVSSLLHKPEEQLIHSSLLRTAELFDQHNAGFQEAGHSMTVEIAHALLLESPTPTSFASYHVLIRLDFGKALMHEVPMAQPPFDVPEAQYLQWHRTDLARRVFQVAHEPLFLSIRAMNFCWGETSDRFGPAGDMVSTWHSIVDELNSWYGQRPQEFLSMVEIETVDDGFPMMLFTSGAALFGNQLYHTAMFLLLRHKPRTVMLPNRHRRSTMSTLWHARRICGIALNNERRECWDMSLVSSLLVAARTMTHEAQHRVLSVGIDRIETLTGWGLGTVRDILKCEWGL